MDRSQNQSMRPRRNKPEFGEFIIYVDESGDHGLQSLNPGHPIFVLAFCMFRVSSYIAKVVPGMQSIKFKYFGHDMVILHEREIRKSLGSFSSLYDQSRREAFMTDIATIVERVDFEIFACVIDKEKFRNHRKDVENPYSLALAFGLDAITLELMSRNQAGRETFVIFESRGKREDQELESEFRRITEGHSHDDNSVSLNFLAVDKKVNSSGLQIADMVARPIGLHVLRPEQKNRALAIILQKIHGAKENETPLQGLKVIS
jgi:hypothetical protein